MPIWNPNLAVGVAAIDGQHQELFARADALLAAMRARRSAAEVKPLLDFLGEYCTRHFSCEEELMTARGYAGREAHLAQHRSFVEQFEDIVETFRLKGPAPTVTLAIQELVCGWLVRHIRTVDTSLAASFRTAPALP